MGTERNDSGLKDVSFVLQSGETALLIGEIVSHNLSCATYVDKVIHLKDGKIIEMGSHKELLDNGGEYARLFKMQAEKYLEK